VPEKNLMPQKSCTISLLDRSAKKIILLSPLLNTETPDVTKTRLVFVQPRVLRQQIVHDFFEKQSGSISETSVPV